MSTLRAWCLRFAGLFDKEGKDRELAEELESHIQMHVDDNLRAGMSLAEARRNALVQLGGIEQTKERYRDRRGLPLVESVLLDLRFAVRVLQKSPGFTIVAVITLALGLGANAAIFTVVDAVLLRPLPFRDPSRLVMLWEGFAQSALSKVGFSAPDFVFFERAQNSFESIGAFQSKEFDLTGNGQPERVIGTRISASVFPTLGVEPILGRTFAPEEDAPGHNVVLLSYGLWKGRYGGDEGIVGRAIELDRGTYSVVGIMPKDLVFPVRGPAFCNPDSNQQSADFWLPMAFTRDEQQGWGNMYNNCVIARLKRDVTLAQARAESRSLSSRLNALYPSAVMSAFNEEPVSIREYSLQEEVAGQIRTPLLVLMTAVTLVMLIACANVATLLLARAATRHREIAVRAALGATRKHILRQLLSEGLLLAICGSVLGFILSLGGKKLLLSLAPGSVPLPRQISTSGGVVVFLTGITVLTSVFFALVPAFQISRFSPQSALQEGSSGATSGRRRLRLQGLFVTIEFSLALVLLIGAGLLIRSFATLLKTDPGFRPDHVLTLSLPLPFNVYPKASQVRGFYDQLLQRLRNLPGVTAAGLSNDLPLENRETATFEFENPTSARNKSTIAATTVLGNYFQVTGISLLRGRSFTPEDRANTQLVVMISQTLAASYWPNEDPIGKRIRWGAGPKAPWRTVVGTVGDVYEKVLDRHLQARIYMPYAQMPDHLVEDNVVAEWRSMNVAVRTQQNPASIVSSVVAQIHSLDPDLAVAHIRPLEEVVSSSVAGPKFNTTLVGIFASVALILAAIGIFGVLAYTVAERTHEIGIRRALGAQSGEVLRLVLMQGIRVAGAGAAAGVVAALGVTHLMRGLLYGVTPTDPLTFVGMVGVLIVVAMLACWIPAWRAMRVDPAVALRHE